MIQAFINKLLTPPKGTFGVAAEFNSVDSLMAAVLRSRAEGYTKLETYTPFPIHGMDEALGSKPSVLGYIVIAIGLCGTATAIALTWWVGTVAYPLVIGGKPLWAVEFTLPIIFELTILFSAFAAVFGMFHLNRLPQFYHAMFNYSQFTKISDDSFVLVIESADPKFNAERATKFLSSIGGSAVEEVAK